MFYVAKKMQIEDRRFPIVRFSCLAKMFGEKKSVNCDRSEALCRARELGQGIQLIGG